MKINGNSKKSTASRAAAGTGRKRGGKKRGGAAGTAGVTLIILAVLIAAAVAGTGFYVKSRDTIFPNVSVGDVRVGGLTVEAAKTALLDAGYETDADNVSVTVTLPNNDAIEIPGAEAGLRPHADEAAQRAFEHGRDAGLLGNELSFIKSLFTPTAIDDADFVELDRDFVRAIVSEHVSKFNDSLTEGSYKIDEQGISITKGAGSAIADVDAVFTLTVDSIMQSLDARSPVSAEYNLPPAGDDVDLVALFNNVNVEPVSAVYDAETKTVTQSVTGISFDMASARRALELAESGATVTVPLIRTEPEVTTESLTSLLFRDIISERTTNIAGTSNRLNNVTLAAEAINGLILNPGETFSFNESVGQRTSAKGYKEAGAYAGGKTVQEIGGGICQVSSTLYDCVLYADLEVVARSNHMFVVTYLPYGNDATVNWGTVDFKFKNNTDYPIRVETEVVERKLTIKLHGTKLDDHYIKVEYVTISSAGFNTIEMEDASVAPGTSQVDTSGHGSLAVETYKYFYDGAGALLEKTFIARSSYRAQDRIILVPVGTLTSPEPSPSGDPAASPEPSDAPPSEDVPYEPPIYDTPPPPPAEPAPTDDGSGFLPPLDPTPTPVWDDEI